MAGIIVFLVRPAAPELGAQPVLEGEDAGVRAVPLPRAVEAPVRSPAPPPPEPLRALPQVTVERDDHLRHGALQGKVISAETGLPVAQAVVSIQSPQAGAVSVTSDADGRFEFVAPASGLHRIAAVQADGFLPFGPEWGESPITFSATPGMALRDVVIALTPALEFSGIVRDASGAPVEGADIRLEPVRQSPLFPQPERFTSDAQGRFRFTGEEGTGVVATHPEHGQARAGVDRRALQRRTVELTLRDAGFEEPAVGTAFIEGEVLDERGERVSGAMVQVRPAAEALEPRGGARASTDGAGRFRVEGLVPGLWDLRVQTADGCFASRDDVRAPASGVQLRLARGTKVTGRVIDERGGAVPAFVLNLLERDGPLRRILSAQQRVYDPAGRFTFENVRPGEYVLEAAANGLAPGEVQFTIGPAMPELNQDVTLPRGGTVRGQVRSKGSGQPLRDARVLVEGLVMDDELAPSFEALTDASGTFEITGVPSETVSLSVSAEGHDTRIVSRVSPGEFVQVELTPSDPDAGRRLELVGIGAVLVASDEGLVITGVLPGGGAAAAGLVEGDEILAVDGTPVTELGFGGAIQRIRGPEGSRLVLTVRKGGKEPAVQVEVVRTKITG